MDDTGSLLRSSVAVHTREKVLSKRMICNEKSTAAIGNNNLSKLSAVLQSPLELVFDCDIPEGFRTPFIKTGYRKPGLTMWGCFKSLIEPTNETVNVWTHVLALVLFLLRFSNVFSNSDFDPWCYGLVCFAIGIASLMAMSSSAHLINCMSLSAHHIGFYLDYAAICVYSFSGSQAFFFYSRPSQTDFVLLSSPTVFLTVSAIMSCLCTAVCCASRHRWLRSKYVIRTSMFMLYFIIVTSPFTYRLAYSTAESETSRAVHYFNRHIINYILSAFVNVTKLPERYFP
ncbi:predicted protein, partial [Nematostella vectensis]